jgi:hypothetical protein
MCTKDTNCCWCNKPVDADKAYIALSTFINADGKRDVLTFCSKECYEDYVGPLDEHGN